MKKKCKATGQPFFHVNNLNVLSMMAVLLAAQSVYSTKDVPHLNLPQTQSTSSTFSSHHTHFEFQV